MIGEFINAMHCQIAEDCFMFTYAAYPLNPAVTIIILASRDFFSLFGFASNLMVCLYLDKYCPAS